MTLQEKIEKVKRAQEEFLSNIDALSKKYKQDVQNIMKTVDSRKIAAIKKELGL